MAPRAKVKAWSNFLLKKNIDRPLVGSALPKATERGNIGSPAEGDGILLFNEAGSGLRIEVLFLLFKGTSGTGVFEGTFFQMQGRLSRRSVLVKRGVGIF